MPPGSSTARGSPVTRRIPNNSKAGTTARSGAVTAGPSAPQVRTISPVVSTGAAGVMLTVIGVLSVVGMGGSRASWSVMAPATHTGDTLWCRNRDLRPETTLATTLGRRCRVRSMTAASPQLRGERSGMPERRRTTRGR